MDEIQFVASQGTLAVVVGFGVEALKRAGMDTKYAFLAAGVGGAILGLVTSLIATQPPTLTVALSYMLGGVVAGSSASGFYSGSKKYVEGAEKQ